MGADEIAVILFVGKQAGWARRSSDDESPRDSTEESPLTASINSFCVDAKRSETLRKPLN